MPRSDLIRQLAGSTLTTAEVHYYLPDYPSLLQLFVWQDYDEAPDFPALRRFLRNWEREIDAALHSVKVMHRRRIGPADWRSFDGVRAI
jgi:uncharacterized protein Usg